MSREKLIELIKTYDTFDLKEYNKLINKYGKGNVCIALQKMIDSAINKEEFDKILSKYSSAYISMYLDCNQLTDEQYTSLLNKFGEQNVEKFFEEMDTDVEEELNDEVNNKKELKLGNAVQTSFLRSFDEIKLLTREEEKDLFEELGRLKNNLNIGKIEKNSLSFNDVYSVIYSLTNEKQKNKLKKISDKLCDDQKKIVNKYLDICKKNNGVMPNYVYLKQYFGDNSFPKYLIDDKILDEQLDNIISTYDIVYKIWNANIKLVVKWANKLWRNNNCIKYGIDSMDLVSEGSIGLYTGIEKFDVSKGFKFSTYATCWICQAILRSIENSSGIIRIPVHFHETSRKIGAARDKLSEINGVTPSNEEVAAYLNISVDKINYVDSCLNTINVCSLDMPVGMCKPDEEGDVLLEFIRSNDMTPEEQAMKNATAECLYECLSRLTDREREVIIKRFGLYDQRPETLGEVGQDLNVTRERIRQIESKAIRKLRRSRDIREIFDGKISNKEM